MLISQLQGRLKLGTSTTVGLNLDYFMLQYFDLPVELTDQAISVMHTDELAISPFWELQMESGWKATAMGTVLQNRIEETDEDYTGLKMALEVQKTYGFESSLLFSVETAQNSYENWEIQDSSGNFLVDTQLETVIQSISIENQHVWSRNKTWITETNLLKTSKKDNGSGYLNSDSLQLSETVRYQMQPWKTYGKASIQNLDYPERMLLLVEGNPNLNIMLLKISGGIERKIVAPFVVYAELTVISSESNDSLETYQTNAFTLGASAFF